MNLHTTTPHTVSSFDGPPPAAISRIRPAIHHLNEMARIAAHAPACKDAAELHDLLARIRYLCDCAEIILKG